MKSRTACSQLGSIKLPILGVPTRISPVYHCRNGRIVPHDTIARSKVTVSKHYAMIFRHGLLPYTPLVFVMRFTPPPGKLLQPFSSRSLIKATTPAPKPTGP